MAILTELECANLLTVLLEQNATPESIAQLAKPIGYNLSPLLGAKGKRNWFIGEVVMANVALAIHAVNQTFGPNESKAIIDRFLASTRVSLFNVLEQHDSQFKARYSQRMTEYFKILHESQPALGFSFAFMQHCDLDPLKNLSAQLHLAAHFGSRLKATLELLREDTRTQDSDEIDTAMLAAARAKGDTRNELILSVMAVADEALKIEKAWGRVYELYEDRLEELLTDSCLYFPVDISVELDELRKYFEDMSENVEMASSCSTSLAKRMESHVQRKTGK